MNSDRILTWVLVTVALLFFGSMLADKQLRPPVCEAGFEEACV